MIQTQPIDCLTKSAPVIGIGLALAVTAVAVYRHGRRSYARGYLDAAKYCCTARRD